MPKYIDKVKTKTGKIRYVYTKSSNKHRRDPAEVSNNRGQQQTKYYKSLAKKQERKKKAQKAAEQGFKAATWLGMSYLKSQGYLKDQSYKDIYGHTMGAKKVKR